MKREKEEEQGGGEERRRRVVLFLFGWEDDVLRNSKLSELSVYTESC